jgi:hypothetical protein
LRSTVEDVRGARKRLDDLKNRVAKFKAMFRVH